MSLPYALEHEAAVPSLVLISQWVETRLPGVTVQVSEKGLPLAVRFPFGADEAEVRLEIFRETGRAVAFAGRFETALGVVTVDLRIRGGQS